MIEPARYPPYNTAESLGTSVQHVKVILSINIPECEKKLNGNTILVTGGGSGIGKALAESFHRLGNQVVIAGRRKDRLMETAESNAGMEFIELDIASHADILRVAKHLEERFPELNVIVNNAGIMHFDNASNPVDDDLMESIITTNLMGPHSHDRCADRTPQAPA